ncbi:hypothetical protein PIB30_018958 [Stylosanthes scabra]|uniref:Uncharacterized protein n=1 Tax=Stylosanthes scabra TaxID=79078 RepID=A0ABU6Z4V1_9FABA|nr:hypothetical protein [Stylosanthes scabra]
MPIKPLSACIISCAPIPVRPVNPVKVRGFFKTTHSPSSCDYRSQHHHAHQTYPFPTNPILDPLGSAAGSLELHQCLRFPSSRFFSWRRRPSSLGRVRHRRGRRSCRCRGKGSCRRRDNEWRRPPIEKNSSSVLRWIDTLQPSPPGRDFAVGEEEGSCTVPRLLSHLLGTATALHSCSECCCVMLLLLANWKHGKVEETTRSPSILLDG